MNLDEHTIKVEASAKIYQELTPTGDGYFDITEESVIRRRAAQPVECACGETFGSMGGAKQHVERVEWIADEWDDVEPLEVGETYVNPDDDSQSITILERTHRGYKWDLQADFDGFNEDAILWVPEKSFTESVRSDAW